MDRQSRTESNHRSDEIPIATGQILHEVTQESSAGDEISNQSIEIAATLDRMFQSTSAIISRSWLWVHEEAQIVKSVIASIFLGVQSRCEEVQTSTFPDLNLMLQTELRLRTDSGLQCGQIWAQIE